MVHRHSCMANVRDNNVYEAQTCALFYYLIVLISVQDDDSGSTLKGELFDPRGSLASDIPSCAIEQANQEIRQDNRHSQHPSNA